MISNLHSLFNQPWYIEESYANSHLPFLFGILDGKQIHTSTRKEKPSFSKLGLSVPFSPDADTSQKWVAVIEIKSPIYKYNQECGPRGTKHYMKTMDRLAKDDSCAGIVFDTDSGGGQAYGTPEFHDKIKSYPKPTATYTDGLLCSAAYYFASASNYIVANKRSEKIGSIGAYAEFLDLTGFYEKKGAKIHTIYADQSTEKNKSYRDILKGEYGTYIKQDLNPLVDQFISDIKSTRPNIKEEVFKGATYEGPKALEMGLVDSLGTLQDAVNKVFELDKNKSQNPNNTMSKPISYPSLEKALGLDAPLATNDNGSFLNEEQKQAIENTLTASATSVKTAQDAQATAEAALATATAEHATALTAATEASTAVVANLLAAATLAGVENLAADADAETINAALTARIAELNGKPGATHTGAGADDPAPKAHAYVDFTASIYQTK